MSGPKAVSELVGLSGGRVVGRTKLQKGACLLELAGLGYGFSFSYKHFGPYSEELKVACIDANALGYIEEKTETANWGGWYSVFETKQKVDANSAEQKNRVELLGCAVRANPIELELAVTAAFLAANGVKNPWEEVQNRKPTKAIPERLAAAKKLYGEFRSIHTPRELPAI